MERILFLRTFDPIGSPLSATLTGECVFPQQANRRNDTSPRWADSCSTPKKLTRAQRRQWGGGLMYPFTYANRTFEIIETITAAKSAHLHGTEVC